MTWSLFRCEPPCGSSTDLRCFGSSWSCPGKAIWKRPKRAVIELLAERHRAEDVTVITQDAVVNTLDSILGVLTLALAAIASVSLTVAGVGIMNVMLVAVSERRREIGLLKALGATTSQIVGVFIAEASVLSTLGGLVGLAAGTAAVAVFVQFYPTFPAATPTWAIVASLARVGRRRGVLWGRSGAPGRAARSGRGVGGTMMGRIRN